MKCMSCNAPLSIEDEKCPYCGTPNPDAIKHRQDMKHFTGEFHRTRSSVLRTASESASKSMRIVILCVMTVLLILSFAFLASSWDIASAVTKWQAAANSDTYCALLDQYEEEGDFLSFAALYDQRSLYGPDVYEEYRHVYTAASNYSSIYGYIMTLLEEEHWEDGHENALKYLCESLDYHYEYLEREPYEWLYETGAYDERHLDAVDRMTEKIENLLQMTFSMTEDEMVSFREFSPAEKQVFIERRFEEHE